MKEVIHCSLFLDEELSLTLVIKTIRKLFSEKMVFAKVLCTVFVLSLVDFGESEHLKNYDNSTVKSVLPRMTSDKDPEGSKYKISVGEVSIKYQWGRFSPFLIIYVKNIPCF